MECGRDISVIRHDGNLQKIQETRGYYDPLEYTILSPFGTHSWDINTINYNGRRVSCRAYYSYMLQIRPNDQSMLLNAGRLLQQYDDLHVGETNTENIGKRTILSSSFIGGRRDMTQRYEDGMVIVLNGGGHCKKRYPKQFLDETRQGTESYPEYKRRFYKSISLGRDRSVDNRWVVPYNPWLLLKYDCHINVEICSSMKSIKYLYKYVYKSPDRVAMEVHKGSYMDEVQ
ncbi:uncharacterized protein LOC127103188 [Lathyrus oleraceus]|uniref:uncharacterized protein LOC127103188 n=1 Tax=Pisum sativum TaxID=3888 RepID=UPI0021CEB7D1|nr:uncharacterized protein LOC127103188 [Pisum sativum]